jgi:hypothetical protein
MEALVPFLIVVNIAVTIATLFAVFRAREGFAPALLGISLGWVCFLVPLYFFGPWGGVLGMVFTMIVGGIVNSFRSPHDRKRAQ